MNPYPTLAHASWSPLRPVAPLDDGSDAVELTRRLFHAASELSDVYLDVRSPIGQQTWQGRLNEWELGDPMLRLGSAGMATELDPQRVVAVSYCANRTSSGVCVCSDDGSSLTLWSAQGTAFDAWLERMVPGLSRRSGRTQ